MTKHPAPFSPPVLDDIAFMLQPDWLVLDPFAGIGRVHTLPGKTVGVEIEPEWASQHPDTIVGDALTLPFSDQTFDAVVTSPCYGNRMADHHNAKDASHRRTYKHYLGRDLSPNNSGAMQWGTEYKHFHIRAWLEVWRVLKSRGWFILNVSDHVRKGRVVQVVDWHIAALKLIGFAVNGLTPIRTKRYRYGANSKTEQRAGHEVVLYLRKD